MSLGFYEVTSNPTGDTTTSYNFANRTVGVRGSFNTNVFVTSLVVRTHGSTTGNFKPVIYRVSDSVRMGEGTPVTMTTVSGTDFELVFNTPVALVAGVPYLFGVHSTGGNVGNQGTSNTYAANSTKDSTPSGITWTRTSAGYFTIAEDSNPGAATNGEPFITISFNGPNVPPVPTITLPKEYEKLAATSPQTFTWTVADSESNAQYRYQIDYRVRDSGAAWTSAVVTSSTPSHTFAANTFTSGQEYEWRLRLDDNQGGGWSPFTSTRYFGADIFPWIYTSEILSSGANVGTNVLAAHGDFESSDSMTLGVWESNNAFGSLVSSTVARTTTKPDTGAYSLEVTLPTLASNQATIANCAAPGTLKIGKLYRLTARVWMQVGGPDFRADMLYQGNLDAPVSSVKGAWTTVTCVFVNTSANGNQFPAVRTVGAATSGQKMYVDNVTLHEVGSTLSTTITPAEASGYHVQVRTADHGGFSPWSATHNAVVNPLSNKFIKVGGVWVVATNHVKVGGIWQQAQPTKIRTGGSFPA